MKKILFLILLFIVVGVSAKSEVSFDRCEMVILHG